MKAGKRPLPWRYILFKYRERMHIPPDLMPEPEIVLEDLAYIRFENIASGIVDKMIRRKSEAAGNGKDFSYNKNYGGQKRKGNNKIRRRHSRRS